MSGDVRERLKGLGVFDHGDTNGDPPRKFLVWPDGSLAAKDADPEFVTAVRALLDEIERLEKAAIAGRGPVMWTQHPSHCERRVSAGICSCGLSDHCRTLNELFPWPK